MARRLAVLVGSVALLVGAAACGSGNATGPVSGGTATSAPTAAPVNFGKPGPYRVGVATITVGATTAVVFYPADGQAAAAAPSVRSYSSGDAFSPELRAYVGGLVPELVQDIPLDASRDVKVNGEGPFPVVIHSHGFGGFHRFASQHFAHEASWGFVVAAPDHRSRNLTAAATGAIVTDGDPDVRDLAATLDALGKENSRVGGPLYAGLDTNRVAAEGHSAGGRASYLFAVREPRVLTWIGQAPSAPVPFTPGDEALSPEEQLAKQVAALEVAPKLQRPTMVVAGEKDSVIPLAGVQATYDWLEPPKRLVVVANAGHASFIDVCEPIREQGGLQRYAESLPAFAPLLSLADDGCGPDNIDPRQATMYINHVMVAQYRFTMGMDRTAVSLSDEFLQRTFPQAFTPTRATP